jgi:hypothetical protein
VPPEIEKVIEDHWDELQQKWDEAYPEKSSEFRRGGFQ